jgi:DNA invertase Pin-like site-specific DNA recombinase
VFRDQQSGADPVENRTMLMDMLSLAGAESATGVSTVVVESSTRLSRELMHQEIFLERCRSKKVEVYGADSEQEFALREADPTRVLIRQLLGALSQWERSVINERLQAGRRKKVRDTGVPCGGPKPYGQTESERVMIHEIYTQRKGGQTFLAIAKSLNERGLPTPSGSHYWQPATVFHLFEREAKRRSVPGAKKQ